MIVMRNWKTLFFSLLAVGLLAACGGSDDDSGTTPPIPTPTPTPTNPTTSDVTLPAKELRGVWMATVWGIDWPSSTDATTQKKEYTDYLDLFVKHNINAVFVQVRGLGDAFYDSPYEPWAKVLTGTVNGNPGYDVLKFMIDEAHKHGLAFHAWINPYRIATRLSASVSFPTLDSRIPASMVKDYNKIRIYNPALPEVQQRIIDIVKDIVTQYNVDGIHMDDYFYPSLDTGESMNDEEEYKLYGGSNNDITTFRISNVNKVIKGIHEAIQSIKPEVVFSVAPSGNYDNNLKELYADVANWSRSNWTEIIIPQLYYDADTFQSRLTWWTQNCAQKNALMIGYGVYKYGDSSQGTSYTTNAQLATEFSYAAANKTVQGSVLYNANSLKSNKVDILSVIDQYYAHPALIPFLGKYTPTLPSAPSNLKLSGATLTWSAISDAYYAIYLYNSTLKRATLMSVTQEPTCTLPQKGTYYVTAVNKKDNAESALSQSVTY